MQLIYAKCDAGRMKMRYKRKRKKSFIDCNTSSMPCCVQKEILMERGDDVILRHPLT